MTVNSVGRNYLEEKAGKTHRNVGRGESDFGKSLAGTIEKKEAGNESGSDGLKANSRIADIKNFYNAAASGCVPGNTVSKVVSECEPRGISSAACDRVKVCMEQGCIYKMQINEDEGKIYVEQKSEDGSVKGYEVSVGEISKNSSHPIENLALETWELYHGERSTKEDFEEALLKFYEYTEDRVKNGPPKIQIGASAISEEDWKKLIEKIDEEINARKTELRERMEKRLLKEKLQKTQQQEEQQKEEIDQALIQKILEEEK